MNKIIAALKAMQEAGYTLEYAISQLELFNEGVRDHRICDAVAHNLPIDGVLERRFDPTLVREQFAKLDMEIPEKVEEALEEVEDDLADAAATMEERKIESQYESWGKL